MSPKSEKTVSARCPECDSRIYFEKTPDVGQTLSCPECGTSLEVVKATPLELDWVFEPEDVVNDYGDLNDDFDNYDDEDDDFDDYDDEDDEDDYYASRR
jgi:lysine biosynthesis protein LysW